MSENSGWPVDYFASRERFIASAQLCGAILECYPIAAIGPADEALSIDVASITHATDKHLIVLISGVHGVEGFAGASVQIETLKMILQDGLPERTGIVLIHAVNPWGFAHLRRVNNNNVDINRNFMCHDDVWPSSHPDYASLNSVINPAQPPDTRGELRYWVGALSQIARHRGIARLFKPIAEGQYNFPKGVFYGGTQIEESSNRLQSILLRISANCPRISILDVHSGLGPSGTATLIGNSNLVAPAQTLNWLRTRYQHPVHIDTSPDNLYDAKGTLSLWCQQALRDKRFLYLCVEIGTVNPLTLFSALRRENQAHHWTRPASKPFIKTKQALREVFAPRSQSWQHKSVEQAMKVLRETMEITD